VTRFFSICRAEAMAGGSSNFFGGMQIARSEPQGKTTKTELGRGPACRVETGSNFDIIAIF
jgi:hypothetical protein